MSSTPQVSRRLARSFLRYLRERVGDAAFEATAASLSDEAAQVAREASLLSSTASTASREWIPIGTWLAVMGAFERRFGDPGTWQLLRETTRACMAVAVAKGWSAFLADVTPDVLLSRSSTFWQMSYDTGTLVVRGRGPRRCRLALEGWDDPPDPVVAGVSEACVVFLVRLGERSARAVESRAGSVAEIDISW